MHRAAALTAHVFSDGTQRGGGVAVNHMFENRKAQAQCNLMTERLILLIWSLDLILRKEDAPKTDPEQTR